MEEIKQQIMQLIAQLPPEEVMALIKALEGASGEQEQAEPTGTVAPEAGPSGVPVKM